MTVWLNNDVHQFRFYYIYIYISYFWLCLGGFLGAMDCCDFYCKILPIPAICQVACDRHLNIVRTVDTVTQNYVSIFYLCFDFSRFLPIKYGVHLYIVTN